MEYRRVFRVAVPSRLSYNYVFEDLTRVVVLRYGFKTGDRTTVEDRSPSHLMSSLPPQTA